MDTMYASVVQYLPKDWSMFVDILTLHNYWFMILAHKLRTYVRTHKARAVSLVFLESRPQITILQGRPPATRVTRQSL